MKKRQVIGLTVILGFGLSLLGCWNYREIESLSIVSGVAFDTGIGDNQFKLSAEIINFAGGKENKIKPQIVQASGNTIFDAARNTIKSAGKKLYWPHAEVIIISEDVARKGLLPILDWLVRDAEPRLTLNLIISKEKTAKEILETETLTNDIHSFGMASTIKSNDSLSKVPQVKTYEFINALSAEGISPVLPSVNIVNNDNEQVTSISGTAVFKKDKLLGFLNGNETKYYLFIIDKIQGGLLLGLEKAEHHTKKHPNITYEIFESKTKVKPVYSNGQFSIKIEVKTKVSLAELDSTVDYLEDKKLNIQKKIAEKQLEWEIENLVKKVQKEYGVDIFGFGNVIQQEKPALWKSNGANWEQLFKNLKVKAKVELDVTSTATTQTPIKVGD